jgi:hypothetical protein
LWPGRWYEQTVSASAEAAAVTEQSREGSYTRRASETGYAPVLLDKLGAFDKGFTGWSDADIKGITAQTLITVCDRDVVTTLEHAVRFLQLRSGDVNGDSSVSRPRS